MITQTSIRPGGPDDIPVVLGMFDTAIAWLAAQGRTGQWGSDAQSADNPRRVRQIETFARTPDCLFIAEVAGEAAGALAVGLPVEYIEAAGEPELYVNLLITDRRHKGAGVGAVLLRYARELAEQRGVRLMRVDCYAGDDGKLVQYYVSQGFTPVSRFAVGQWPGQLLEVRW